MKAQVIYFCNVNQGYHAKTIGQSQLCEIVFCATESQVNIFALSFNTLTGIMTTEIMYRSTPQNTHLDLGSVSTTVKCPYSYIMVQTSGI